VSHIKSVSRSEGDVSFHEDSITQQKKELDLQFSANHGGMLPPLEPMLVPYLFLEEI
jgi:hypothetical protein